MAYVTPHDLISRFGIEEMTQRADLSRPPLVSPELLEALIAGGDLTAWPTEEVAAAHKAQERLVEAITDAQSVVDGYLGSRCAVPLVSAPASIKRYTCDIARYSLHEDHATEAIQKRYDAAISYLRDVSTGKVSMDTGGLAAPVSGTCSVEAVSDGSVFGRRARGL